MTLLDLLAEKYPIEIQRKKDLMGEPWVVGWIEPDEEDADSYIEIELVHDNVIEMSCVSYFRDYTLDTTQLDARDPRFFEQLEEKLNEWNGK